MVTVVVLAAVFTWSTVMIVLGHAAAAAVLLSSLGLMVQQIVQALTTAEDPARPDGTGTGARDGQEAAP
ncbi:hypothetical protein [Streptomyces sp. CL12-4]|uniref:hypothetical protein n=1 Tax=Streptomyces sp. CL12-4 TaxID=2810306 RepID=UPI001EFA7AB9|nr:hypothetical protein [Streptomyces sp. CL12-4]MCG8970325.1 hypothetical protein [Streptomyces sp. CL12-4]